MNTYSNTMRGLYILCICLLAVTANAKMIITGVSLSSLNNGPTDIDTIASGGFVLVDCNDTLRGILVAGGTWYSNGGYHVKSDGFAISVGTAQFGPADTLTITNSNIFNTNDFYQVGGTTIFSGASVSPVVVRTNPTSGNGSVLIAGGVTNWANVKFVNMEDPTGSAVATGGVQFTGLTHNNVSVTGMSCDSANVGITSCTAIKLNLRTINSAGVSGAGISIYNSTGDTVRGANVTTYGVHGAYVVADNPVFIADTFYSPIEGSTFQSNITFGGVGYTGGKIDSCFLRGTLYGGINASQTQTNVVISHTKITGATHEQIHVSGANNHNWTLYGNTIYGGGARGIITAMYGVNANNWKLYYNTIASANGGSGKGAFNAGCVSPPCGGITGTGWEMIGNIFTCSNGTYGDICIDPGTSLTLTHFSYNAFNEIDTTSQGTGAHFNVPSGEWSTNKITSHYGFGDSSTLFNLVSGAPVLNCGETTIATTYLGITNAPADIGYYQSNITGSCGTTPTGACCQTNGTCATMTSIACTGAGGSYYGDGVACASVTCPGGPGPSPGPGPAPFCRQLNIALLAYWGPMWQHNFGGYVSQMRDWSANRYGMIITTAGGTQDSASIAYMKTVNPKLKVIGYDLHLRLGTDSANIAAYSASSGISVDSMFLRTGPQVGDSAIVLGSEGAADGTPYTTPGGNKFVRAYVAYVDSDHLRFLGDARKWQYGAYLYSQYKAHMAADNLDGIMQDEEVRHTGLFPGVIGMYPDQDGYWPVGQDSIVKPFTGITAFPDSQVAWRAHWAQTLGDSMAAHDKILIPNGASYLGLQASQLDSGFNVEGRHATVLYGGMMLNETMTQYYSYGSGALSYFPKLAYRLKDSAVNLVLGYFPVGWVDSLCSAHLTLARQRQNFLGAALMCEFPRTNGSKLWLFPKWQSGQYYPAPYASPQDFIHNYTGSRSWVCQVNTSFPSDSSMVWSPAWGMYFGTPSNTRDTSQTGTDGATQSYKVWKATFTRPDNGNPLTFAAMRFPINGFGTGVFGATSNVNVTLPSGGPWYELIDNFGDSAHVGSVVGAFWKPSAQASGTTFTLANAQARVFSSDTVLANAGVIDTTLTITGDSKLEGQTLTFTVTLNRTLSNRCYFQGSAESPTGYTATEGVDYLNIHRQTYSIAPGELTTTISVTTYDDGFVEGNETLQGLIATPTYGTIAVATATGTIIDNDVAGQPGTAKHFPHWRKK